MMAIMVEQLNLEPGSRVLEIGAGTGYNAAILAHVGGETGSVITMDIDQDIVDEAAGNLAKTRATAMSKPYVATDSRVFLETCRTTASRSPWVRTTSHPIGSTS